MARLNYYAISRMVLIALVIVLIVVSVRKCPSTILDITTNAVRNTTESFMTVITTTTKISTTVKPTTTTCIPITTSKESKYAYLPRVECRKDLAAKIHKA